MTLARGPILNPGFYWIDSFPQKFSFTGWLARQKGLARAVSTRSHLDESPPREWILFEVLHPATWTQSDAQLMGFPTVAPRGAQTTEEDSRSAPEPSSPGTFLEDALRGISAGGIGGGLLLLAGLLLLGGSGKRGHLGRSLF